MKRVAIAVLLALTITLGAAPEVAAEARLALVIGNSDYADIPLANPVNDARLMSATLREVGFEVLEHYDVNQNAMKYAIIEFGERLDALGEDAVGLFYYAGHGLQVDGQNYLVPIGAKIAKESHVAIEAVSAGWVLGEMEFARNRMNFVILDACRNNPLTRSFRSQTRGLARMDAPRGSLVAYSTAPGDVALDGDGVNSPYTEALARAMLAPGISAERMFKQVRDWVMGETDDQQVPWEESSLTGEDFYFGGAPTAAPADQPADQAVSGAVRDDGGAATERMFWESVQDSADPAMFEAYLAQYPDGAFAGLARLKRDAVLAERSAATLTAAVQTAAREVAAEEAAAEEAAENEATREASNESLETNIAMAYMRAEGLGEGAPTAAQVSAANTAIERARAALAKFPEMPKAARIPATRLASFRASCVERAARSGLETMAGEICDCMIGNIQRHFSSGLFKRLARSDFIGLDSLPSKARNIMKLSQTACLRGAY